jgi:outer membrane protein TolC
MSVTTVLTTILPTLIVSLPALAVVNFMLNRRSDKRRLASDLHKAKVETDSEFVTTAKELVGGLREELERQRLVVVGLEERIRVADRQVGILSAQTARLTGDFTMSRAELVSARAELAIARNELELARADLRRALGQT